MPSDVSALALGDIRDNILLAQSFWRAIMGLGNIYRHDYDNVEEIFVWRTVQNSLGPLMAAVQGELGK